MTNDIVRTYMLYMYIYVCLCILLSEPQTNMRAFSFKRAARLAFTSHVKLANTYILLTMSSLWFAISNLRNPQRPSLSPSF